MKRWLSSQRTDTMRTLGANVGRSNRMIDTRWLRNVILAMALGALLTACGGDDTEDPDVVEDVVDTTIPMASVNLNIGGTLTEAIQSFDSNGTEFTVETQHVYLVVGNFSVLEPGEPLPAYVPGANDPLEAGWNSVAGYQVI